MLAGAMSKLLYVRAPLPGADIGTAWTWEGEARCRSEKRIWREGVDAVGGPDL